jgi:hypothetical protein
MADTNTGLAFVGRVIRGYRALVPGTRLGSDRYQFNIFSLDFTPFREPNSMMPERFADAMNCTIVQPIVLTFRIQSLTYVPNGYYANIYSSLPLPAAE